MPQEDIDALLKAREHLTVARRRWAKLLTEPFDRDQRPEIAANFVSIQEAIDAVDRALADERGG